MPKEPSEPQIPAHVSATIIEAFTGVSVQRIYQLAIEGRIPKSVEGLGFPFAETVRAFWDYQIAKITPSDVQVDKAAIVKAERETAEIRAAEARGELVHKPTAQSCWLDGMIRVRDYLLRTKYIRNDDRRKVLADVKALGVDELKIDE